MTIPEIQQKLYEKLKLSGWGDKLKMFVLSKDFENILMTLYNDSQNGKRFTPTLKQLFRAFEECPYDKLKVIVIAENPYPKLNVADGIAFSCSNIAKEEQALTYLFDEIERTVYNPSKVTEKSVQPREKYNLDLKRWANQGVLLLNTSMTTELGNVKGHKELWKPFITYLLDMLSTYNTGLCYAFLGKDAKEWNKAVPASNYKFFTSNPISAYYHPNKQWNSGNLFNQINNVLINNYGDKIIW
jgi:uracil-DNA glycosylase